MEENWELKRKKELGKNDIEKLRRKIGMTANEILMGIEIEIEEIVQGKETILQVLLCRDNDRKYTIWQIKLDAMLVSKFPIWITNGANYSFVEEVLRKLTEVVYEPIENCQMKNIDRRFVTAFYYKLEQKGWGVERKCGFEIDLRCKNPKK